MSLIECHICKQRSVEYDPRCRSFICLMENCRSAWSLHVPEPLITPPSEVAEQRQACLSLIEKLPIEALPELHESLVGMCDFYSSLASPQPAEPGVSIKARITGSYTEPVYPIEGDGPIESSDGLERQCPCLLADQPCKPDCSCVHWPSSAGCRCCASYGSDEQRKHAANLIVARSARPDPSSALAEACQAFLARYNNHMVNADLLFSDIAEQARAALALHRKAGE